MSNLPGRCWPREGRIGCRVEREGQLSALKREVIAATPTRGEEQIEIAAAPELVYGLVADLTRMGEWSPECYRVEWVGDATAPAVGAEFKGYNHVGPYRWSVGGKVVAAEHGREFAFTTYDKGRESTSLYPQ